MQGTGFLYNFDGLLRRQHAIFTLCNKRLCIAGERFSVSAPISMPPTAVSGSARPDFPETGENSAYQSAVQYCALPWRHP